ncbi:MAG: uncharacterized protein K0R53_2078 [Burkholderiales bacterium]|jgi:hypothetical protein|nr:uncharacterized protein [Burkholderiales bacterium]
MKEKRILRTLLATALLAAFNLSALAQVVQEAEPVGTIGANDAVATAQHLPIGSSGSVTVSGAIGHATGTATALKDVDFYTFDGKAGDEVTIDIDGAWEGERQLDTVLTLFGPGEPYAWLAASNDPNTGDEGSNNLRDARIDKKILPADGKYLVAVTPFRVTFQAMAPSPRFAFQQPFYNGRYTLIISRTIPFIPVAIDIKPGTIEYAPVNPNSKGNIPVALLGAANFDPFQIRADVENLTFGGTGDEKSLRRCSKEGEDVNGDGHLDRICHFDTQLSKITIHHEDGILKGKTNSGTAFVGNGPLKVIPVRRPD